MRLSKLVERTLSERGLTLNQFRMLEFVRAGMPPTKELSIRLVMKRPNISVLIDALVKRGLVQKAQRIDDRRRFHVVLTPEGAAILDSARTACDHALRGLAVRDEAHADSLLDGLLAWNVALDAAERSVRVESEPSSRKRSAGPVAPTT